MIQYKYTIKTNKIAYTTKSECTFFDDYNNKEPFLYYMRNGSLLYYEY